LVSTLRRASQWSSQEKRETVNKFEKRNVSVPQRLPRRHLAFPRCRVTLVAAWSCRALRTGSANQTGEKASTCNIALTNGVSLVQRLSRTLLDTMRGSGRSKALSCPRCRVLALAAGHALGK